MKILKRSTWDRAEIDRFLLETTIPVRLAVIDDGVPLVVSIWYQWDAASGTLLCVSHQNARVVRLLEASSACGFEIARDDPPYKGVRGQGEVTLERASAGVVLGSLIRRYLGDTDSSLAQWLLGRIDEEVVLRIRPSWITSWDFSARM